MPYIDTSVLAAYYCPEKLSPIVAKALAGLAEPVISPLVEIELCSALSQKVRTKDLDAPSASAILAQFQVHVADGRFRFVEIGSREHQLARDWLNRFSTPHRTLDALHLAAAFAYNLELLTADKILADSAKLLGVRCRRLAP